MSSKSKSGAKAKRFGASVKSRNDSAAGKRKRPQSKQPPKTSGAPHSTEAAVFEPEPAGEDDHAFFDDAENERYANFMLSLDPGGLPSFSKRTKDRAAAPPVRGRANEQEALAADIEPPPADAPTPNSSTLKQKPMRAPEAVVDAKRRHASTEGWVGEATGPTRLPIKTRGGLLKPNERMEKSTVTCPTHQARIGERTTQASHQ